MEFKKRFNTLFFKIILTVILGVSVLMTALSILNLNNSRQVFVESFTEAQSKIFTQIDRNIYELYQDVAVITTGINRSRYIHDYLTKESWAPGEERTAIYNMKKYLQESAISEYSQFSLIIVGTNKKTHNYNTSSRLVTPVDVILNSDFVIQAQENPKELICQYGERGFTDVMSSEPVIFMAKAITSEGGREVDGVVILTMKESDFRDYYNYFTSNTSDVVIFNQDGEVLSSNNEEFLGEGRQVEAVRQIRQEMISDDRIIRKSSSRGDSKSYMLQQLQSTNYTIMGILNPDRTFENAYNFYRIIGVTVVITLVIAVVIFLLIKQQTDPLYKLVRSMRLVRDGNLKSFAKVEGTTETMELAETYNNMLVQLEHYIDEVIHAEAAKREAEINSLQMQINPHYMYNTLASIKWLIWQQDKEKSVQVIDAFIALLRNTISNKAEFITVNQEIENLKNYVLINQVRYGSQVNVEYYVSEDCGNLEVPKLILQPFVENAFFHAFPEGRQGIIQVFAREHDGFLRFNIVDDGVGMDYATLTSIKNTKQKGEHFTGIGINNVDERIELIYGNNYGINIESQEGRGTTITILLPYNCRDGKL